MSDYQLSLVHTCCKKCVFATSDQGCKLDLISKYKEADGVEVVTGYDENGEEFNIIDKRFCTFFRNEEMMKNFPKDTWEEIVRLQTRIPYHAILFLNEGDTLGDLKKTIRNLKAQYVSPNIVTVVNKQYPMYQEEPEKHLKPSTVLNVLQDSEIHQFNMKNVYNGELTDLELIDLTMDSTQKKLPFYISFDVGYPIPENFIKTLNEAVLLKMKSVHYVKPIEGINGMIVSTVVHRKYGGNCFQEPLEEKIMKDPEEVVMVMEQSELC
jgi:hypothetical protein